MFGVVAVRCASRASFTLSTIKFKHGQLSPSSENVPVISTPTTPKVKGKHSRTRGQRSQWKEKPWRTYFQKDASMLQNSDAYKHYTKADQNHESVNINKYNFKTMNESVEKNLGQLGINVSGEVIYGIFPVLLALEAKRRTFHHLIYKQGSGSINENIQNILKIGKEQGIPVTSFQPSQFKKIFQGDQVHQGVCCDASPLPLLTLEEEHLENKEFGEGNGDPKEGVKKHQLWLYLDQIQDPMNFGAVLRSAYFMGVNRVITSDTSSVKITNTVSKASAGVAEFFPVHQVKDPVRLASSLTHAGWEVVSSASLGGGDNTITNPIDVTTFNPKGNILLIVGNEGKGISPELNQMCHTTLTIEPGRHLHPHLHCLNVSVATALLLHSLQQKLTPHNP